MQAPIPPSGSHLWQSIELVSPNSFFRLATALDGSRLFSFDSMTDVDIFSLWRSGPLASLRLSKPHLRLCKHFLECPQSRGTFFLYSIRACRFLLPVDFIARENTEYPVPRSFFASQPHGNACYAGYPSHPQFCPRARAPLISKEGQTGLGMNRTKMAEMADRSTYHDLTTRNHSHSLIISQNTSLYICAGVYIKTFVKFFIHRDWKCSQRKQGDSFS